MERNEAASRIERIAHHLRTDPTSTATAPSDTRTAASERSKAFVAASQTLTDEKIASMEDFTQSHPEFDLRQKLPGPMQEAHSNDVLRELAEADDNGETHLLWEKYQRKFGNFGLSSNFVVPNVVRPPQNGPAYVSHQVMLANPEDCQRIAKIHTRKSPGLQLQNLFFDSVISTQDNELWKQQREHLVEGFLPTSALADVFQISVNRAAVCADRLAGMAEGGDATVNLHEFLLHEALAQLHLGLFGQTSEEFTEETNRTLRGALAGTVRGFTSKYVNKELEHVKQNMGQYKTVRDVLKTGGVVSGQIPKLVVQNPAELENPDLTAFGNMLLVEIAGHDTTGNTMTWLMFELSKNPELQQRLRAEVDELFALVEKREAEGGPKGMQYRDLHRLPLMTKCIMETLRMWPVVPNGTFRELQFDDHVMGNDGEPVMLPKGTHIQVLNWVRHRNEELWGEDANTFNPDREWQDSEVWHGQSFAAYNPATPRFSPFTFQPRDCLGKNFAQMEMRAIICHLLRRFEFKLAEPTASHDPKTFMGVNRNTMGPRDLSEGAGIVTGNGDDGKVNGVQRVDMAMHVHATPRAL